MSSLNIEFPMHLTVKFSQNEFYPHQSPCKLENMLKTVLPIIAIIWSLKLSFEQSNSNITVLL